MTYKWTPHPSFKDAFNCETGDNRAMASITHCKNEWQVLITIETNDEYIHLKTLRPTKLEAMAAIEVQLSDLLPIQS